MLRTLVRWALALLLVMAAFILCFSAAAGLIAGIGAWLLFRLVDAPLFEPLRKEFMIAAGTISIAVFFGMLASLLQIVTFSNSRRD